MLLFRDHLFSTRRLSAFGKTHVSCGEERKVVCLSASHSCAATSGRTQRCPLVKRKEQGDKDKFCECVRV